MFRLPRHIVDYGPAALLLNWEQRITPDINQSVHAYARLLTQHPAVQECIPAYASLLVRFFPPKITAYKLKEFIFATKPKRETVANIVHHELPVCYHAELAPDLKDTAGLLKLTPKQLVKLHTSVDYLVYQLGFRPGFGFMGETPGALEVPRLERPRRQVPAGAVGLAGRQTGIYPSESPGGWRLIGRCPLPLVRSGRDFTRLRPGDTVRFVPITLPQYRKFNPDQPWPKR
ncbi:MAG: 5-oxoprolinase subunit PxpB [Bacteroidota bacterium]